MRTLLRRISNGEYFQSSGRWTLSPSEAFDFRSIRQAIDFVEQEGFQNMEVTFLLDNPRRFAAVRIEGIEDFKSAHK